MKRSTQLALALAFALPPIVTTSPVLASPAAVAAAPRPTRLVPNLRDGKPHGVKVFAIEPGSPYHRAGFQPGDTLLTVQGAAVTAASPDPLARALAVAPAGSTVKMTIERRGNPGLLTLRAPQRQPE